MTEKKYYWLRLKKDFFKRHDIQIVESMPNGKDYVLFYLKMLAESVDHNGNLRFSDMIPYDENMLATITNTNVDIVRSAMKIFTELNMIEVLEDKTIFMSEVTTMLGSETYWAAQKRKQRDIGQCPNGVQLVSNVSKQEIEKEIDIDIYKNTVQNDVQKTSKCTPKISKADIESFYDSIWELYPNKKGKGRISDKRKRELYNIGYETISTAISRYKTEIKKDSWRHEQNGSTFFNTGIVDYLDGNYVPGKKKTTSSVNYKQRDMDVDAMESELISNGGNLNEM